MGYSRSSGPLQPAPMGTERGLTEHQNLCVSVGNHSLVSAEDLLAFIGARTGTFVDCLSFWQYHEPSGPLGAGGGSQGWVESQGPVQSQRDLLKIFFCMKFRDHQLRV